MFTPQYATSFKREVVKFYLDHHTVKEVLQKYSIAESTLFVWKREYLKSNFRKSSRNRLNEYKQRLHHNKLEQMLRVLQFSGCDISSSSDDKIRVVEKLSGKFSIRVLCEALKLPRGTYYNRLKRKFTQTQSEKSDCEVKSLILEIFNSSNGRFGKKPIKQKLLERGFKISEKRISRLMKELGLCVKIPVFIKHYKKASMKQERFKNILDRNFTKEKPNFVWVSDISFVKVQKRFIYICVIIDIFSRKVISFHLSEKIDSDLTLKTFDDAFEMRGRPRNLLFHTDQGIQYTSFLFMEYLKECHVIQSFSKPGTPYDNAVCESFFGNLKKECIYHNLYQSMEDLANSVMEYVLFFNSYRPHRKLKMKTPDQVENEYFLNAEK